MSQTPEVTSKVYIGGNSPKGGDRVQHPRSDPPLKDSSYEAFPTVAVQEYHYYTGHVQRRRSSARRFCTSFAFVILVTALLQTMMVIARYGMQFMDTNEWTSDEDFPIPPDLERVRCAWGDEIARHTQPGASLKQILRAPLTFPFIVQERFELPVDADNLFFLSRGVYSHGQIKVERSGKASDVVKVDVRLEYTRPGTPRIAKVCQFKRGDKEVGFGVFTPEFPEYPRHSLTFLITVTLPKSDTSAHLHVKKFETDMPDFTQLFGRLGKVVFFDDISLKSVNGGINARSITAERGSVETTNGPVFFHHGEFGSFDVSSHNGPIQGVFNATGSLFLSTSNNSITAEIHINTDDNGEAILGLHTSHSHIDARVWLNNLAEATGGDFGIVATTDHGPIKLDIVDSPVDSKMELTARTTEASALVVLPLTYEGRFELNSTPLPGEVQLGPRPQDPSGRDRKRGVKSIPFGTSVIGDIIWLPSFKGRENGHVYVETNHSPAVLWVR
jgi:hypothetical protein